ncbi:hypothetical protein ES705_32522 [subsurface metagenome]
MRARDPAQTVAIDEEPLDSRISDTTLIAYMILFIQKENSDILKTGVLLGWVIGLVAGQIFGKRRDNEMKKQERQL